MRCTFCATGKGGFARNLMPHEIVDQVKYSTSAQHSVQCWVQPVALHP
jgi:adenine C2-methylase RlmN of 23S rRNA A2503 and tRNA A37